MGWGTYNIDRHPRVGIIFDGLEAQGFSVRHVTEPSKQSTADRVALVRKPWRIVGLALGLLGTWARLARQGRAVRKAERPDCIIVGYLGHADVIAARLAFPRSLIVLDHLVFALDTARDREIGSGPIRLALRALDRIALACASVIVVDTEEHARMVPRRRQPDTVVAAVGAPWHWYEAAATRSPHTQDQPLSVVFFALFTPLQGAPVIAAALAELHRRGVPIKATFEGTGQDAEDARRALGDAPVEWNERLGFPGLPEVVASHDVCLGIFGTSEKALNVAPNKVFQGAAAGCCIVTSDTEPQRRALGDAGIYVPAGNPLALADALEHLARNPEAVRDAAAAAHRRALEAFSPKVVAADLAAAIVARAAS